MTAGAPESRNATMTTYTVLNMEMNDPETDEHVSGLTLEEAANLLIERARLEARIHRVESGTTLILRPDDPTRLLIILTSTSRDQNEAIRDLFTQLVLGEGRLPGPYLAIEDGAYRRLSGARGE